MTIVERLVVRNVRVIKQLELILPAGISLIHGRNGSGKTSFLEAIHILGTAKSFRAVKSAEFISNGEPTSLVVGHVLENSSALQTILGVEKSANETICKVNQRTITAASELARYLSIVVVDSHIFRLLEEGPANRRALLDRALFHVERGYLDGFKYYFRALKSRNELAKSRASLKQAEFWNEKLAFEGERLTVLRQACVAKMNDWLDSTATLNPIGGLSLEYKTGWPAGKSLMEALSESWIRDCEVGSTQFGPHRGELRILLNGKSAVRVLSRGQMKLVACAIIAAQAAYIKTETANPPLFLIDDVAAELDRESCRAALSLLLLNAGQTFITSIEGSQVLDLLPAPPTAAFHVERGCFHAGL